MPKQDFHGLRVLSLESRRAAEISSLIATYGGESISAPSMREVPLAENQEALRFVRELISGSFDIVVFLTGVGARALLKVVADDQPVDPFLQALRHVKVVARGPKPLAVLREWNVPVAVTAPEPCTWRELVTSLNEMPGGVHAKRIVIQEYGVPNQELISALQERGAVLRAVAVYQWALPQDTAPLRAAVTALIAGQVQVALFTTGVQATHLFHIAREMGKEEELRTALRKLMVASIGPSTTETLHKFGIPVDLEPSHPKMGVLVKEAAERSAELAAGKSTN